MIITNKFSKYKFDIGLFCLLIILAITSILVIYSSEVLSSANPGTLAIKQGIWYLIGFVVIFLIMKFGTDFFFRNAWIFYIISVISLVLLFFFAPTISNSKCWFVIPKLGNIQPSEFMKIFLIFVLARIIEQFNSSDKHSLKDEFVFLLKVLIVVGIPSILTFLQPDTGVVLIYILITLSMLLASGIRLRWFVIGGLLFCIVLGIFFFLYFFKDQTFIDIFGTNFFYRMDRIVDWRSGSGMQYQNASIAIGSASLFGHGFMNTPIYFPEAETDFIFAVLASNFGIFGSLIFLIILVIFDCKILYIGYKAKNSIHKYVVAGIIGMLLYQQIQNIGMTIGLLPITGITLPFISYGGSSLLSIMMMIGFIFTISNEDLRNKKCNYL